MDDRTNPIARRTLRILPGTALVVAASVLFLDEPLALAIQRALRSNPLIDEYAGAIPDLLLPAVLALSAWMWAAWLLRVRKGLRDARTGFYRVGGTVLPLSFLAKSALKLLFGRIETRVWLKAPAAGSLHWFQPGEGHGGFPSGHMTVFAALGAACWIFFPRLRGACLLSLLALGAALVATNHHFLSDVVGGGYLGMAVTAATMGLLKRHDA